MADQFSIGAIAIAVISILGIIVKYFISTVTRKDEQMIKLMNDFNAIISSHMIHENDAFKNLTEAIVAIPASITTALTKIYPPDIYSMTDKERQSLERKRKRDLAASLR